MKNLLLTLLLVSGFALTGLAQSKIEQYCQMNVFGRFDKFKATINYGNSTGDKPVEEKLKFKSVAESLNFLGASGWKLVSTKTPFDSNDEWIFIFKKEVDKQPAHAIDPSKVNWFTVLAY